MDFNESVSSVNYSVLLPSSANYNNGISDHIGNISSSSLSPSSSTTNTTLSSFLLPWYTQSMYILFFVLLVIIAAGGNIIVIWIVLAHKRMRTVTNYFLVNLAVADTLISLLNTVFNGIYMLSSNWIYGEMFCKFSSFIAPCTIAASVFTFVAIAVDRYIAILHPLKPRMNHTTVLVCIGVIWVVSSGVSLPNLVYARTHTWTGDTGEHLRTVCYLAWPDSYSQHAGFAYDVVLMMINYVMPLFVLSIAYSRVGFTLWGSKTIGEYNSSQSETIRSKRRVVKMMMVVVVIFALCWLPQHAYLLISKRHPWISETSYAQHIYLIIYWLAMSNCMYNPIIYCWMNDKFRQGFRYAFRFLPCIRWDEHDANSLRRAKHTTIRYSVTETTRYPSDMVNMRSSSLTTSLHNPASIHNNVKFYSGNSFSRNQVRL